MSLSPSPTADAPQSQSHPIAVAIDRLSTALAVVAALLLTAATVVVCWMVFYRAMGNSAYWELEFAIYMMVMAMFLGSPYCLKTNGHVNVDLLTVYFPVTTGRKARLIIALLGLGTCLYLAWASGGLALHAYATGETSGTLWNPPRWPLYAAMPLGMLLTALQYVAELLRLTAPPRRID